MQKLYFLPALMAVLFFGAFSAQGQRSVNMQTTMLTPINNQTVTIGTAFPFKVEFKNLGPDSLKAADTILYTFTGAGTNIYFLTGRNRKSGDTILVNTNLTFSSASVTSLRFCVYSAITNGVLVADPIKSNDSSCIAKLNIKSSGVGVETIVTMGSDKVTEQLPVYPNPASGIVTLDYTARNNSEVNARVVDLTGREVMARNFGAAYPGKQGFSLDISSLQTGLYFVELRQEGVRATGKINKQ